jgi:hypothetical protein
VAAVKGSTAASVVSFASAAEPPSANANTPAENRIGVRHARKTDVSRTIPSTPDDASLLNNAGKSKAFPEMMAVSGSLSGNDMEPQG